ncbi:hypothetical protein E5678_16945 [Hydrogenophaga sp. PAMC20947]|nr:hypothetical protein E5678_16945 [Hydrogenophaga sp. PAMC20947]
MLGATGAVGGAALSALLASTERVRVTTLGRGLVSQPADSRLSQHVVDVADPSAYATLLAGHDSAICTLGVGQPSKISREAFVRIDKDAVLAFATACKQAGVRHFELLGSLGSDPASRSFFLRTKGELQAALVALGFERLSLFQPSMILTPSNRYGLAQAITLAVWPKLNFVLQGRLQSARGIPVEVLGAAMAHNLRTTGRGVERLTWRDFMDLVHPGQP